MRFSIIRSVIVVTFICSLVYTPVVGVTRQDKRAIVKKAGATYYNLKALGVNGFKCEATPNWDKFLADNTGIGPLPDEMTKKLKMVLANVSVSDTGSPTVTPVSSDGADIDESLAQPVDGLSQMISGFYQAWWPFVFDNPFSDFDSDFDLKDSGSNYELHQKQGGSEVTLVMGKDYLISEMDVVLQANSVIFRPKYIATNRGFLLSNIESDIQASHQHVTINIDYTDVEGLKVPSKVSYKVTVQGGVLAVDVGFGKYQLIKG